MMDVDHFKAYNDYYGHLTGDDCLKKIAGVLCYSAERVGDLCARYGGEEFVCLLPHTDPDGARYLAESIMKRVAALNIPHAASPVAPRVTVSIEVATTVPEQQTSSAALIEMTDKQLYNAKSKGRNKIEVVASR